MFFRYAAQYTPAYSNDVIYHGQLLIAFSCNLTTLRHGEKIPTICLQRYKEILQRIKHNFSF